MKRTCLTGATCKRLAACNEAEMCLRHKARSVPDQSQPIRLVRFVDRHMEEAPWTRADYMPDKQEYLILSETEKGYWVDDFGSNKFVLKDGQKIFAHVTEEKALESYKKRKIRQAKLLRSQLGFVEGVIKALAASEQALPMEDMV